MLTIDRCTTGYGDRPLFTDLSCTVDSGEIVAVLGRSGSGKTTLLHIAAGIREPWRGSVTIGTDALTAGDHRIGFVQQHYGLFPWFTVEQNVALGLRLRGVDRDARRTLAAAALRDVALDRLGDRYPGALSGGEQQRVALARTIVTSPEILLLDEPFSALDAITREELQEVFLRLQIAGNRAALLVTHSSEEAVFLSDRIAILSGHPARLRSFPNPWRVPLPERTHLHRGTPDFLAAVAALRHRYEEENDG